MVLAKTVRAEVSQGNSPRSLSRVKLLKGGDIHLAQRLFVGNLPYSLDSAKLQEVFSAAGNVVSAQVMVDRMSGRSRGFGFVEMSTDEETQKAVDTLNGFEVDGRKLVVNIARPREERPERGGYNDRRGGGDR